MGEMRLKINRSLFGYGLGIIILHVVGICLMGPSVLHHPTILGLGFLAYTFGLRHAFDVDHIAAIDNTVRKLRQENKTSNGVGFYFSLGHSTVVFIMAVITVLAVQWAQRTMPVFENVGGIIGTMVSAAFLLIIGIVNLVVLISLYRVFKNMRHNSFHEQQFEDLLHSRGFIYHFIAPLFKIVKKDWHIYPIGFLFGLGFDTASEVALLAISAGATKNAIPFTGIIALPILFASGMSLMDTVDAVFMTTAYNWAFATPLRKVYYNLTVTGLSVFAALFIGLIEVAQVLMPAIGLRQGLWSWLEHLNFGVIGVILVCLFFVSWLVSYGIWRLLRVEQRWSSSDGHY